MGWLFEAGLLAGRTQAVLILLILVVGWWTGGDGDSGSAAPLAADASAVPSLFRLAALGAAAVAALLARQSAARTAARIVRVANDQTAGRGRRLQIELMVRLWLAAGALAILTIAPVPVLWTGLIGAIVPASIASLSWTAGLSVGVAYFSANAYAAALSLRR